MTSACWAMVFPGAAKAGVTLPKGRLKVSINGGMIDIRSFLGGVLTSWHRVPGCFAKTRAELGLPLVEYFL